MEGIVSKNHIDVLEHRTTDGGTGIQVCDGAIVMGRDAADVERLLSAIFYGVNAGGRVVLDGDLLDAVAPYLDGGEAYAAKVAELAEPL